MFLCKNHWPIRILYTICRTTVSRVATVQVSNLWTVSKSEIAFLLESEMNLRFVSLVPTNRRNGLIMNYIYIETIAYASSLTIFK